MYTKLKENQVHPGGIYTFIPNITQPTYGVQNWKHFKVRAALPFCKHLIVRNKRYIYIMFILTIAGLHITCQAYNYLLWM